MRGLCCVAHVRMFWGMSPICMHVCPPQVPVIRTEWPYKQVCLQIKNKQLKWGVAITTFVVAGFGLPVVAIRYSNSKLAA